MNKPRYPLRLVIWAIFHPVVSIARYETALTIIQECGYNDRPTTLRGLKCAACGDPINQGRTKWKPVSVNSRLYHSECSPIP